MYRQFQYIVEVGDDPHRIETCSIVDYFNIVYKLCLTVIKTILVLFIKHNEVEPLNFNLKLELSFITRK
jgi:hypothetical protein